MSFVDLLLTFLSFQSTETKKITYDKEGNQTTTVHTTDRDGKQETRVLSGRNNGQETFVVPGESGQLNKSDNNEKRGLLATVRYLFVNPQGYTLPRNLW